jgi:hypothetical protein
MDFNGLKGLFRWIGGKKNDELTVVYQTNSYGVEYDGWYIMDGSRLVAGPYFREKDAKGQRTRLLKGYTPASRRPV